MLVLDVPTRAHIAPLVDAFGDGTWLARFRAPRNEEDEEREVLRAVFHFVGEDVLEDGRYRAFMNGFPADVQVSLIIY
jgi:ribonuclease Z